MRGGRGIGRGGLVEAMAWWLLTSRGYRKPAFPWCDVEKGPVLGKIISHHVEEC